MTKQEEQIVPLLQEIRDLLQEQVDVHREQVAATEKDARAKQRALIMKIVVYVLAFSVVAGAVYFYYSTMMKAFA